MTKSPTWTPEQDQQLKLALQQKISVQRLAVRFNRSASSIKFRAGNLGLDLPARIKIQETAVPNRWVSRRRLKK